jgi:DNA excision repair protein ERCC-4
VLRTRALIGAILGYAPSEAFPEFDPMRRTHSICIDHREHQGRLTRLLLRDPAWVSSFRHLAMGDYLIDERILVERKTLPDLAASIKDGRLFAQAKRLAKSVCRQLRARSPSATKTDYRSMGTVDSVASVSNRQRTAGVPYDLDACISSAALLIEGRAQDLRESAMTWESMRAALATVSVFIGVPVLRTTTAEESAKLLHSLASQGTTLANGGLPRMGVRPKGKRGLQLHLLQGLPGIGPERAARLLDHFGSVRLVMTADEKELCAVAGIGLSSTRRIVWAAEEPLAVYGGLAGADP